MIFILEGCDKSGKTTLADKLCKEYDATYLKFSAPKRNAYKEYSEAIDGLILDRNYVLDRFCYGELIYGPLYRGQSQVTLNDVRYLETRLLSFDPIIICCLTDPTQVRRNFRRCHERQTKVEHIMRITQSYLEIFKSSKLIQVLFYNYLDDLDHEDLFERLRLIMLPPSDLRQPDLKNFIGNNSCDYLFVGDKKNKNIKHKAVFDSTSGRFLLKACDRLKILRRSGFCNSLVEDELLDLGLLERVKPTRIVALGKESHQRLGYLGLRHSTCCHPQFAKRFYGKNALKKYVKELKKALS